MQYSYVELFGYLNVARNVPLSLADAYAKIASLHKGITSMNDRYKQGVQLFRCDSDPHINTNITIRSETNSFRCNRRVGCSLN